MPFRKTKEWGGVSPLAGAGINYTSSLVSGLIAAVPLNESSGQTATNYIGVQKLTGSGVPTWAAGKFGPSLNLVGASSQYVSDNTVSNIKLIANSGVSVTFWIFLTGNPPSGVGGFFTIGNSAGTRCMCEIFNNNINFDFPDFSNGRISAAINSYFNTWLHVGLVSNGSNSRAIYFNGKQAATGSGSSSLVSTLTGLWIGAWQAQSEYLTGKMSNFKVWNRMLNQTEIYKDYSEPFSVYIAPRRRIISQVAVAAGIAFNGAANSGDIAAANTFSGSASWAGSNRFLGVDVSLLGAATTVTSMTYGGAACTKIGSRATVTSLGSIECWGIKQSDVGAPAAGANTLTVNLSGSIEFSVEWASYTGVNQITPTESFNSAQATNVGAADATVTITTISDNDWVHGAVVAGDTSITANQTSRNNISGTLGSGGNEDSNAVVHPAGTQAMSYTGVGALATWAIAGYGIIPVADFEAANRRSLGPKVGARSYQ